MSTGRPSTALLCVLVASAALGVAVHLPQLADIHQLAASALLVSLAMAALALTGALLQQPPAPGVTLGLERGALGPLRTAALVVGTIGLSQLLNTLLVAAGLRQDSVLVEIDRSVANAVGGEYALLLVALAIAPGIAEEVLFRGFILRSVAGIFGPAVALLSSSLLFGLVHADAAQGGAAAILGLYLGAVALRGGSVRACILCHIANNIAAMTWVGSANPASGRALLTSLGASAVGLVALASHRTPGSDQHATSS